MKTTITAFALVVVSFVVSAQDSLSIRVGTLFNPQGNISLDAPEEGTTLLTPLLVGAPISFKGNTFIPHYNIMANATGLIYDRTVSDRVSIYVLANKFLLTEGIYASIGVTHKMGFGAGFIEVGSTLHRFSPDINIGLILPLTFKVK